jgi:hypothetical protein
MSSGEAFYAMALRDTGWRMRTHIERDLLDIVGQALVSNVTNRIVEIGPFEETIQSVYIANSAWNHSNQQML